MRVIGILGALHLMVTMAIAMVRESGIRVTYWIRPYDMMADRRRWRWCKRTPCRHLPSLSNWGG